MISRTPRSASATALLAAALTGLAVVAAGCSGCADPEDRAAKKRLFSPEDPPKQVLAAAEPIDAAALEADAALAARVLAMSPGEAFERVGPYRLEGTLKYEWTAGAGSTVRLSEQRVLEQAGADAFRASSENDRDQGLEILRLDGKTFARSKYLPFRERRRDRGQADQLREDVFGGLRSVVGLMHRRLGLSADGAADLDGRACRRYRFTLLADAPAIARAAPALPPVQLPQGGPDADTRRRLAFFEQSIPKSVEGELWVDATAGVPLKAELVARLEAPGPGEAARLTLRLEQKLKPMPALPIESPKEFLPDEDRPNGIAAALERFGIERPDAGSERPESGQRVEPSELQDD